MEFLENYPTDKLIPYARNSRTHNDEQIAQIVASIKEFGFTNPILIGGDDVIIAGHGRLLAAQRMGLKEVPVIRLPHLSETQRKALVIADNKIALNAGWDEEMLALEMKELSELDFDLDILGFSEEELKELATFGDPDPEPQTEEDEIPELPTEAVTKPGDIWILGNHRLLCGDTTLIDDVQKLMQNDIADMIFTDPPYNVNYGSSMKDSIRYHAGSLGGRKIMNDNLGDGFAQFLTDALSNLMMYCQGAAYVCMSSSELTLSENCPPPCLFYYSSGNRNVPYTGKKSYGMSKDFKSASNRITLSSILVKGILEEIKCSESGKIKINGNIPSCEISMYNVELRQNKTFLRTYDILFGQYENGDILSQDECENILVQPVESCEETGQETAYFLSITISLS